MNKIICDLWTKNNNNKTIVKIRRTCFAALIISNKIETHISDHAPIKSNN